MSVSKSRSLPPLHVMPPTAGLCAWLLVFCIANSHSLIAQDAATRGAAPMQKADPAKERSASSRRAIGYYSDAAAYQNKSAFKLAIDEWKKLLDEYPEDPLASKAWHYLGVCYTQLEQPDYGLASAAFESALKDKALEVREESLINLSWSLFSQARAAEAGSKAQRDAMEKARSRLKEFLSWYSEGAYMDQALFYMGEIEYSLGDLKTAIANYKKLIDTPSLAKSSLRPGGLYALSVAYEEAKQENQAASNFRLFLAEFPKHRLAREVAVRLSDLLIKQGKTDEAAQLLSGLLAGGTDPEGGEQMADYALLRMGYALASQGKNEEAAKYYTKLLDQFPNSSHAGTAALSLGQSLYQSEQYDQAIQKFNLVLKAKDAQAAEAAHWMAITFLRQNTPQKAVKLTEEALVWAKDLPSAVSLQMDYADALYAQPSELEQARSAYEKIVTEYPESELAPRAAYNAAFAALQGGKVAEARKWSELFLNRFPQDPLRNDVAAVAAEALLQQGEHKPAATAYDKLRQVDSSNPAYNQWTLRQAMAYYLSGDYQASTRLLETESKKFTTDDQKAEALFILGTSYLYQENIEAAIEQLTASHQTSDRWSSADEVLLMLSEAQQRNKDNDSARATLEDLLKKYPKSRFKVQVEYKLAQLSAALNQFDKAITRYEAIVDSPDAASYHNFATYGIVWCLMQQEKYAPALERLQPLLTQGLRDSIGAEAKLAQGVCMRKTGQEKKAIIALQEFIATKPSGTSLANGLYEVALAYRQQNDIPRATAALDRIVQEVPSYPGFDKVLYELAWNHQENSDTKSASNYFERLAKEFPESSFSAEATYMLAQSQYDAKEFGSAATTYASVLTRTEDPDLREKAQYKLGWSYFQQERYPQAAAQFSEQALKVATGPLAVDALFMNAECAFKQNSFQEALAGYQRARQTLETTQTSAASEQVKSLIYLHGAQCYRELARWNECEQWLRVITKDYPESPYLWTAVYELGYCKQKQDDATEALKFYGQVVDNNRNEIGARARFMMGEVYFSQRDFQRAIEEFTRVAYGFGGEKAPDEIKNWQAKSAYEAARCYEVLVPDLRGDSRNKAVDGAKKFYEDIVRDHAQHELAKQATSRLGELQKIR